MKSGAVHWATDFFQGFVYYCEEIDSLVLADEKHVRGFCYDGMFFIYIGDL